MALYPFRLIWQDNAHYLETVADDVLRGMRIVRREDTCELLFQFLWIEKRHNAGGTIKSTVKPTVESVKTLPYNSLRRLKMYYVLKWESFSYKHNTVCMIQIKDMKKPYYETTSSSGIYG